MGFHFESKILRRLGVSALFLGWAVSLPVTRTAFAAAEKDECTEQSDADKSKLKSDEKKWNDELTSKQDLLDLLAGSEQVTDDDYPGLNAPCNCLPNQSSDCSASFWSTTMKVQDMAKVTSDTSGGCMRIYTAVPNLQAVDAACYSAVAGTPGDPSHPGCGAVRRLQVTAQLKARIKALNKQIDGISDRRRKITDEYKECRKECSDCGTKGAQSAQQVRTPGIGDYLIGGLQAITPMVLGGMGMYENSQGLNAYTKNYGAYLNQCQTVGVPCGSPMYGGMGGGMMGGMVMGGGMMGGMMMGGMMSGGMMASGSLMMGGMMMGGTMMGGYPVMGGTMMGGMMMGGMMASGSVMMGGMMMGGMMSGGYPVMGMMPSMGMMPMSGGYGYAMGGMMMGGMMQGGMMASGSIMMGGMMQGGMMQGGLYGNPGAFTAGYGMPVYPYGTGFGSAMFPMGAIGGGGMYPGMIGGGGYPGMYPGMIGGGGYPMTGQGGFMGPIGSLGGGYGTYSGGGYGLAGGLGYGMAGGYGYATGGTMGYNPQYASMYGASQSQAMLQAQSAAQSQQDYMIAQQQLYSAQSRIYQMGVGGYGYGYGGGYGSGLTGGISGIGGTGARTF